MTRSSISLRKHIPYAPGFETEDCKALSSQGTRGETLTLCMSIISTQSPTAISVEANSLQSAAGLKIEDVSVRFVHQWNQAGVGLCRSKAVRVGELLLKDGADTGFQDSYRRVFHDWKHLINGAAVYVPPLVRVTGPVTVTLNEPGSSVQIWITIGIPDAISAGEYSGALRVTARDLVQGDELAVFTVPVEVKVHAFDLQPVNQRNFIWYKGSLDPANLQHYLDAEIYEMQLQDIFAHGFRSITLNETDAIYATRALQLANSVGFNGYAILHYPYPPGVEKLNFGNLIPVLYVSDELDWHMRAQPNQRQELLSRHIGRLQQARQYGFLSMCSMMLGEPVSQTLGPQLTPEIVSLYLPSNAAFFEKYLELQALAGKQVYYYWQCHMEKPNLNRLLTGLYLWRSKASGISCYCYQHLPQAPNSPFNDFSDWEPNFSRGNARPFRHHMTTYPAREGIISTVQWEAIRDGITDHQYLETFDKLQLTLKGRGKSIQQMLDSMNAEVASFFSRLSLSEVRILDEQDVEPYVHLKSMDYWLFRDQLRGFICELMNLL